MSFLGLSSPYLKDIPLPSGAPGFPYNPELCAYIPEALQATANLTVTPADFGAYGLAIDTTAAGTFLQLAIGQSNSTYVDPAASQFLGAFLTLPQAAVLAAVDAVSPPASAALSAITAPQWLLLQGYLASLVPTWGTLVFSQWLSVGGGGMISTKTVESWLYGKKKIISSTCQLWNVLFFTFLAFPETPEILIYYITSMQVSMILCFLLLHKAWLRAQVLLKPTAWLRGLTGPQSDLLSPLKMPL